MIEGPEAGSGAAVAGLSPPDGGVACTSSDVHRYLDEQAFRYNERKDEDGDVGRFHRVVQGIHGWRLMQQGTNW